MKGDADHRGTLHRREGRHEARYLVRAQRFRDRRDLLPREDRDYGLSAGGALCLGGESGEILRLHAEDRDVASVQDLGRRRGNRAAQRAGRFASILLGVMREKGTLGELAQEAGGKRLTHDAKPDDADPFHGADCTKTARAPILPERSIFERERADENRNPL